MIVQPWAGLFLIFFAIHLYKGWRTPSAWQTLGLKNTLRNHVNDGQQQSYKPKHVKVHQVLGAW